MCVAARCACLRRSAMRCLPSFPAENSRSFGNEHKNSRFFRQKIQKLAFISAKIFQCLKNLVSGLQKCVCARLPSQGRALLTIFCLLALLAFLPQGRALRQKTQKFEAHFWRKCERTLLSRRFPGKVQTHFVSPTRFRGKCACARLAWRDFGESASAFCFPDTISGKMRLRIAFMARFWGKCGRILLAWRVFGENADAFWLSSQRDALLTTFCLLAMLAFLPFHGKKHKNSRHVFGESACARGGQRRVLGESARSLWRLEQKL